MKELKNDKFKVPVLCWANENDVEDKALEELINMSNFPHAFHHISLMADGHAGRGVCIGSVFPTKGVIIPNAVGSDAGCGMSAVKTNLKVSSIPVEVLRKQIMRGIRRLIPFEEHKTKQLEEYLPSGFDKLLSKTVVCQRRLQASLKQLGTLGMGNHFLELQRDPDDNLWIMIHSGSRGLGGKVADYYNEKAEMFLKTYQAPEWILESKLAYLPIDSREGLDYWNEAKYCVEWAKSSRKLMMMRIQEVIFDVFPEVEFSPEYIDTVHNFVTREQHYSEVVMVHRKGAMKIGAGEIGIIPGSQGTNSYIVRGLERGPESYNSSSHGAGRKLSRTAAVNSLNLEEEKKRLDDLGIVHALRFKSDLEEAAGAYKDIHEVMDNQKDLVEVVTELSPVAVIKGS